MSKIIKTSDILQTDELERQVRSLKKDFQKQSERGIAMMSEYECGCPLFLGLNPSFPIDKHKPIPGDIDYNPYYPPIKVNLADEEKKDNRHFIRAIEISKELGFEYVYHYDLLSVRETDEDKVRKLLSSCPSYKEDQIRNATTILSIINPDIIIVENGLVRELFFDKHVFNFYPATKENIQGWNEELGVDFVRIGNSYVPILFTGMLASLNSGSFHSLKWHIRHILRNKDKWPKFETQIEL